jgi:hypothetical protein
MTNDKLNWFSKLRDRKYEFETLKGIFWTFFKKIFVQKAILEIQYKLKTFIKYNRKWRLVTILLSYVQNECPLKKSSKRKLIFEWTLFE